VPSKRVSPLSAVPAVVSSTAAAATNPAPVPSKRVPLPPPPATPQVAQAKPKPAKHIAAPPPPSISWSTAQPSAPPEPVTVADPGRQKYDRQAEEWARGVRKGDYAVQFELVCQTSSLSKAVSEGGESVWFLPVQFRGQPCYRVLWGHFSTRDEAGGAISRIPETLRTGSSALVVEPITLVNR
jgi:septal ring-binding cell division protein DamX